MYQHAFHTKDISKLSFLVTGAAGFIGSHIVEYLLHHGAGKVVVLDDLSTGNIKNIELFTSHKNFHFIQGDIRNLDDCKKACEGIDYLSHQAALGSVPRSIENPLATHAVNATGFINMMIAARDAGIKRISYASSSSVYGDLNESPKVEERIGKPLSPYAVSKLVDEQYAAIFSTTYNMQIIGLRYFNIFGPRQNPEGAYAAAIPLFIQSTLTNKEVFINGDGEQSRDFTFVANAVQANIRALLNDNPDSTNKVYNIACGDSISVNEMYRLICQALKSNAKATHRGERFGDVKNSKANISLANKMLGYSPVITFNEGLEKTIEFYKNL